MPKPTIQLLVCVNERDPGARKPSCGPRGGLAVYRRIKDVVRQAGLRDHVMAVRTGCLKHCGQGITVCVWPHNHWYRGVTLGDAEEIVGAAVDGTEIARLSMPDVPWQ